MPITPPSRILRDKNISCPSFFCSPQPAGRKITVGFTYLQRIGKAASYDVWFPQTFRDQIGKHLQTNPFLASQNFPAQWAAVRQFELLQESGNHKIYDLDPANIPRALRDLSASMRAGGYRITVATMGCYEASDASDELEILDQHLQERISQMINMLYLEMQSDEANHKTDQKLQAHRWNYRDALPHIGMVLGAHDVFHHDNDDEYHKKKKKRGGKGDGSGLGTLINRKHRLARQFFDILGRLPQNHIIHDTAIGLQLPELKGDNQWNYIAASDETLAAFNSVLGDLFHRHTFHLRGYGERLTDSATAFYRSAALALH